MSELTTERLLELAEQKMELLMRLREMSLDQKQIASTQRVDDLLSILSRKQEVIEDLNTIQGELKYFQAQDPAQRRWSSEAARDRCRALFASSERLVAELLEADNQTLGEMIQQRELIGQQLNHFTSAEAIHEAYAGSREYQDVFQTPSLSLDG